MANEKLSEVVFRYTCEMCDYKCCNKTNYDKHLSTRKHLMANNNAKNQDNSANNTNNFIEQDKRAYVCQKCNKEYVHQSSLCKHKKTCKPRENIQMQIKDDDSASLHNIIAELIKNNNDFQRQVMLQTNELQAQHARQTNELQKQILELCKNGTNNTNCNNNTKNKFNINVFLNDTCKDALNLSEFIDNMIVSREDLENTGRLGFVEGISKIIIDHLRQLDVTKRPIHCTDSKRETMYIKDENKWNKELDSKKVDGVIQSVSHKSNRTLLDWKGDNPDYSNMDSFFSQNCLVMAMNSMAGEKREQYYPKVARLIAKETVIDRE
jgi:hypothetical protein